MPRTQKRWMQDQGLVDGIVPISPWRFIVTTGTLTTAFDTSNGPEATISGATATVYQISLDYLMFRSGMQDDLQQAFGGASTGAFSLGTFARAAGLASPPNTFSTPAGVSGPPPFTGTTEFTPVTAARPKGIQINSVTFDYLITTNNASVNTVRVLQFNYANAVAPVATTLLASGTNGMQTTAAATPYSTTVALTTPAYLIGPDQRVVITWSLTPGAGGGTVYGVQLNTSFNFN